MLLVPTHSPIVSSVGPLTITYLGSTASTAYNTNVTGSINFGTATTGAKYVVIVSGWRAGGSIHNYNSPTVDSGTYTFTAVTSSDANTGDLRIRSFLYDDAAGAVGGSLATSIVSTNGGSASGATWYRVDNAATGQPHDQQDSAPGATNVNHTLDVVEGGGIIAHRGDTNNNGEAWSWSGDMVNADEDVESSSFDTDFAAASKDGLSADAAFNVNASTLNDGDHSGISLSFSPV